jgi:glycosyltransferase involved in cell wall biosynthesis
MKITIITVCFNSEKTIEKTILSVLDQNYDNIEYIIVDGNSTDRTIEVINQYKSKITKVVSEDDKGLYDAMNKGIKLATGGIIGILNSDDVFYNKEVLKEVAKFHLNNSVDASGGNIVQHKNGRIVRLYNSSNWNPEKLKIGFMPPHPSMFFKRELFEKYGYYKLDYISSSDYELILRLFLKNKLKYKYSGITTTSMTIGGVSSSGLKSYMMISKELIRLLKMNNVSFSSFKIHFRIVWKIKSMFNL